MSHTPDDGGTTPHGGMSAVAGMNALGGRSGGAGTTGGAGATGGASMAGGAGATSNEQRAPGGYVVVGNRILDAANQAVRLRGANLPSLIWDATGAVITGTDTNMLAAWGASCVRLGLNQGFWLQGTTGCDTACYRARVAEIVGAARAAGLDVILDLHWATANRAVQPQFMEMPDADSVEFWRSVAAGYKDDGHVHFELYNEPHSIDWTTWRAGGTVNGVYDPDTSDMNYARDEPITYQATGMQALYDAVRSTGAKNLVIAGGLDWSFDLSGIREHGLAGYNIVYATHLYPYASKLPDAWDQAFGFLRDEVPLIVSEFGPGTEEPNCPTDYADQVLGYANDASLSWTAWDWFAAGAPTDALPRCNSAFFYAESESGTPVYALTPFGERIRAELMR